MAFNFTISKKMESGARTGVITTPHGEIQTPAFIPVGTKAAMKAMTVDQLKDCGAQAMLVNAYHLNLRPGPAIIEQAGGVNEFMNWSGPTFSDSGGFQVMSLASGTAKVIDMNGQTPEAAARAGLGTRLETTPSSTTGAGVKAKTNKKMAKVDDDGVTFRSILDGSKIRFTPEISMQIQHSIGADITFAFDELTTLFDSKQYQIKSINRTFEWAKRSVNEHHRLQGIGVPAADPSINVPTTGATGTGLYQALFGVIQGANFQDLRELSASQITSLDFDGFGYGGALEKSKIQDIIRWINAIVDSKRPRHLLGISNVDDIFNATEVGIDTFDCVAPTREARNGAIYTKNGRFNIKREAYKTAFRPIEEDCGCYTCSNHTMAYVNHLLRTSELLGFTLASIHNEWFIIHLIDNIRNSIENDSFPQFKEQFLNKFYN
jgi:queuine tRNA-ribosyltransferase